MGERRCYEGVCPLLQTKARCWDLELPCSEMGRGSLRVGERILAPIDEAMNRLPVSRIDGDGGYCLTILDCGRRYNWDEIESSPQ